MMYLFDGGDELERYVPSDNTVIKRCIFPCILIHLHRLNNTLDTAVLTGSSGLLLVNVVELGCLGDGLTEGNSGFAGDARDVVLPFHPFDVDVEVELSHAGDDCL